MKKRTVFFLMCLALVLSVLSTSCQKTNKTLPILRIGHAPHDHHSPLYIAAVNPVYFKEHGGIYLHEIRYRHEYELIADGVVIAKVLIQSSTGGKELIRKVAENHFDMTFGGVPAMLHFIDQGSPIRIVAPVMAEGAGLVVKKDLPADNWEKFVEFVRRGGQKLRIGYKMDISVQNLIFESGLQEENIRYGKELFGNDNQLVLVNLYGAGNLIPALRNGLIDGFICMQPFPALAEKSGVGKVITLLHELPPAGKWSGCPCCALAARDHYLRNRPEISTAMVALVLRANQFIADHPRKSARQIAKWLEIPFQVEQSSIPTIKFTTRYDALWKQGIDFWVESMIAKGMLQGNVKTAYKKGELENLIYDHSLFSRAGGKVE